ncbi:pH-response regulator protein palI/RIM9 [Scheffersomyces stipitis CBS 6054]|uniref:pH-response regulator protein palI/RIM9 n=1 Tax=Scheffersomyces stipitis (strain ATCC 58785 / CBS 6054 / NBRC 10063 / NRRL Y-11545) TaxID=322104 RepID=A3LUV8_PICST|nr:pH-response regulator protein palI/RIM9 [Scheffersomyces stipitis CBS 6054]ABN67024.2 pH-response regulator protein palI/RIM9 [Scheffersomyces stipitis CBS 6054]KAG2731266.1 hypothetical protein G9P44_005682 [Scheffersomyces stipitis]
MYKTLLILWGVCCICLVIQLLPVISVPITSPSTNIYLSSYRNFTFGVFGICDATKGICSEPRIGYPSVNSTFYLMANDNDFDNNGVRLPSSVTYTISKLLIVHVIAFCFSCILTLIVLVLIFLQWLDDDIPIMSRIKRGFHIKSVEDEHVTQSFLKPPSRSDSEPTENAHQESASSRKKNRDITPWLDLMQAAAILSFLCNLLGFLSDILLFIPNLSYLGWLQLVPIIALAILTTMSCFIKRSIKSRKYLQSEQLYENDEMRMRKKIVGQSHGNDSDDGFYVYTNGFYSTQNKNSNDIRFTDTNSHQFALHNNNSSSHVGWVHHSYPNDNDSADEEISLNSSHGSEENIPLSNLNIRRDS